MYQSTHHRAKQSCDCQGNGQKIQPHGEGEIQFDRLHHLFGQGKQTVPIWEKANLTIEEAAAYFGIGTNKLREITSNPDCGFVIWIGTKRLIKRKKFEKYLEDVDTL